ncbi:MAG: 1-phosphofructokinase [Micrococcaceae bacterium]
MIYTVTLNPAIDYIVRMDELKLGEVNRMDSDLKLPGGKGINVSRILERTNSVTTALGFMGGFTGNFIKKALRKEHVTTNFTEVDDDTRINIKIKDTNQETEINGLGPKISNAELEDLKTHISNSDSEDIVVFSGSKPASVPDSFYQELINIVQQSGAEFVIDTTGKDLMDALPSKPLLVKPNNHELAELFNTEFNSVLSIIPYGKKLLEKGAKHALVSMAGDGALLFTKDGVYQSNVLKYPVKNSVGAGDSMIAGFVGNYSKNADPIEAFKWGVACGSATAFSDDLATEEFIKELLPNIDITKIK